MPSSAVILATACYGKTIRFWEAPSGICYRTIQFDGSQINKLDITPDKQYLAAAGNPLVRLYEINTNNPNPVTSFEGHKGNVTAVGFHKDGKWMFTGSEDNTIKIWDLRAPGCQRNYECSSAVNTVVLHPNQAELIAGDQNGTIRVFDLTANACSREVVPDVEEVAVRSVAVAPDGTRLAAANNDGKCFVWRLGERDTSRFEALKKIDAHGGRYILKCAFSPDSRMLATASADQTAKVWSVSGSNDFPLLRTLSGHQRWLWDCAWSADSEYLVTVSSDQVAKLWDSQGETIRNYCGHTKAISCVALQDGP